MKIKQLATPLVASLLVGISACVGSPSTPAPSVPFTPTATHSLPAASPTAHLPSIAPSAIPTRQASPIPPLPSPSSPGESSLVLAPAGMVYRHDGKLWLTTSDGTPSLITPHPYAYLSPDRQMVLYRGKCDNFWVIDQLNGQTDGITRTLDVPSFCPQWASDSRHVYYSKPCEGFYSTPSEGYCEWDIWVADVETGERRNLTGTPDRDESCVLYWAAHPDTLFFYSTPVELLANGGGAGWGGGYLTSIQADGTLYTVILENDLLNPATFSPDGITIAYIGCHANLGHQLYLYHGDAGPQPVEWGRYGLGGWEVSVHSISWSPEGNMLACWATGRHEQEQVEGIFLLDLASETSDILFPLNHPVYWDSYPPAPAWSPDGQWLAFWGIDESRENPGIRIVSTDGREVYAVPGFSDDYWDRGIVWSPDGHWMAFAYDESDSKTGVWLAEVGTWELFQTDLPAGSKVIEWIDDLP